MAYKIPVYLFTGFLEGGKTHMIQESMESEQFNSGDKTLIIQCEEGVDELDPTTFAGKNCYLELIEDPDELTSAHLTALGKKYRADRVIIEYNGMWPLQTLYENLPANWAIFQEMMFAEAKTFITYNQNMRSLMVDKLMNCEMVVLTRTPNDIDKAPRLYFGRGPCNPLKLFSKLPPIPLFLLSSFRKCGCTHAPVGRRSRRNTWSVFPTALA